MDKNKIKYSKLNEINEENIILDINKKNENEENNNKENENVIIEKEISEEGNNEGNINFKKKENSDIKELNKNLTNELKKDEKTLVS